ncbi:MAG: bifunctional folylpolyglutamate synthase/dihydrofolate synthase, partial [Actinobacteria bacterium]|nr:bifunctional folylpolyglutamate synthase/dihydrofolate synthase [Actinomycetota bacterium]
MKKFNFKQVTEYLDDCLVFGIKPDLARIKKILEITGEPQKKCDFIHVVGTNGKTSTTIMTANILKGHGLRCGYHISPHINYYTERIWIDGSDISRQDFEDIFNFIYPYIEKINSFNLGGPMTQFEIIAAMAFTAAADKKLDVMVLEAGMGGRWDATNAADSRVAGLTGVSLEHTSILGKTIGKIAAEKVEVIKKGATVATLSR